MLTRPRTAPAGCSSPRAGAAKPGSTGLPVDGYEVKIIDEQGAPVPPGATGDLIVRGPSTALCYWNRREQTQRSAARLLE